MLTLKIPYKSNEDFNLFLNNLRREYSLLVRFLQTQAPKE